MSNQLTKNSNTPSILTSAGTALASNPARISWSIQNLGTNALFVLRNPDATTVASTTVFHQVLKGGTGNDDGSGGFVSEEAGAIFTGTISVAGTSPRFTVMELAP